MSTTTVLIIIGLSTVLGGSLAAFLSHLLRERREREEALRKPPVLPDTTLQAIDRIYAKDKADTKRKVEEFENYVTPPSANPVPVPDLGGHQLVFPLFADLPVPDTDSKPVFEGHGGGFGGGGASASWDAPATADYGTSDCGSSASSTSFSDTSSYDSGSSFDTSSSCDVSSSSSCSID